MDAAIRTPRQARSRRTMSRILAATESLLDATQSFEAITIQDIVRRAGTSVGAFYARFANKQALLPALYDRYDRGLPRTAEEFGLAPARNLRERIEQIVGKQFEWFVTRRGILRTMSLFARTHPESIPLEVRESRKKLHRALRDLLLEFRAEIRHPDPPRAIDIGLFMVAATFRDKLLFGAAPHASSFDPIEPEYLRDEMSRALLCYLRGLPDQPA